MDRFRTHGDIGWIELSTTDPESAKAFYGDVLGWQVEEVPATETSPHYTVVKVNEKGIGGIVSIPDDAEDVAPSWHSYVTVDDVDAVADRVRRSGGAVCSGPHTVPGIGRLLCFTDPQGGTLCAIEYGGASASRSSGSREEEPSPA